MNKNYCFINFNELIIKNPLLNEDIDLVRKAIELNISSKYQYIIMAFDSKFNGPSFWNHERNQIYEYTTGHVFDASKAKVRKENDNIYISNVYSAIYKNAVYFNTKLEYKTIQEVGKFLDALITSNEYNNYRSLLKEIFKGITIDNEDNDNIYVMKRKHKKLVC